MLPTSKIDFFLVLKIEAFKQSESDQKQLLIKLINSPGIQLSLLGDFCLDMRFDFQECLQLYLEQTILSWEPDISIGTNSATEKQGKLFM